MPRSRSSSKSKNSWDFKKLSNFEQKKLIFKIVKALKSYNLKEIENLISERYKDDWHSRNSSKLMLNTYILMKTIKINSQAKIIETLNKFNLKSPKRRTFNHWINTRINQEIENKINYIINELHDRFNIKETKKEDNSFQFIRDKKLIGLCKYVKKTIYPFLKLKINYNAEYSTIDLLDMLTHVAMTKDFTENGSKTYKIQNSKAPSADTVLYHLNKFEDIEEIEDMFYKAFDKIFEIAKKENKLLNRRKVDVAIDLTYQLYYGDKNDFMVVETKPQKGTSHCFRFATINIVVAGQRFTLLALPMHKFTTKEEVVEKLINYAKIKIRINYVYLDRGFFSTELIKLLNNLKIKWLMPAIKRRKIKTYIDKYSGVFSKVIKYDMEHHHTKSKTSFNLVIVDNKEGKKCLFATNLDIPEQLAAYLFRWYSNRWGVETSYRVKGDFRARTTSKNYLIRLFYFMFSVCLYNLWILANLIIGIIFGYTSEKPLVTAKFFGTMLYSLKLGGIT
jgi:putative transposase